MVLPVKLRSAMKTHWLLYYVHVVQSCKQWGSTKDKHHLLTSVKAEKPDLREMKKILNEIYATRYNTTVDYFRG